MGLDILTDNTDLAVSLDEIKQHLRIDGTDEDDMITGYLYAAHKYAQWHLGPRLLETQYVQYDARAEEVSCGLGRFLHFAEDVNYVVRLMVRPLISVDSVEYYDGDGNLQTMVEGTDYRITQNKYVVFPTLPTLDTREDAIRITYTSGYTTDEYGVNNVPDTIKQAIRMLVGEWYRNREANITGTIISQAPLAVDRLLELGRIHG